MTDIAGEIVRHLRERSNDVLLDETLTALTTLAEEPPGLLSSGRYLSFWHVSCTTGAKRQERDYALARRSSSACSFLTCAYSSRNLSTSDSTSSAVSMRIRSGASSDTAESHRASR